VVYKGILDFTMSVYIHTHGGVGSPAYP